MKMRWLMLRLCPVVIAALLGACADDADSEALDNVAGEEERDQPVIGDELVLELRADGFYLDGELSLTAEELGAEFEEAPRRLFIELDISRQRDGVRPVLLLTEAGVSCRGVEALARAVGDADFTELAFVAANSTGDGLEPLGEPLPLYLSTSAERMPGAEPPPLRIVADAAGGFSLDGDEPVDLEELVILLESNEQEALLLLSCAPELDAERLHAIVVALAAEGGGRLSLSPWSE
ncbi:MAG: hypothetical protein GF403_11675 [Candidatus Coatesbacteria bacterium]|nr:hypothetical protein [Candidatus Coatesbacteria bacterium]